MTFSEIQIPLEKNCGRPFFRQIYEKIRDDILCSRLRAGTRLPATRSLSKTLGISRNAVVEAYEQLQAEGFIESRQGSYTRVARDTYYQEYLKPREPKQTIPTKKAGQALFFRTGVPDLDGFPRVLWGKYLKLASVQATNEDLGYSASQGQPGFCRVLADYLYKSRGIHVSDRNIVITSGATQALYLASVLLNRGNSEVIIEDPGGYGVIQILRTAGFVLNCTDQKEGVFDVAGMDLNSKTRMVYVTPSHQFPMGYIMPASVRIALLKRLSGKPVYIVEDDYDSEFRYNGAPIYPLKALEPEKVIYIGSFSKLLSPGLRIGYAVVSDGLLEDFRKMKRFSDAHSPLIDQIAFSNVRLGFCLC